MKRLLVLLALASLSALANGMTLQISVNGILNPSDPIIAFPSDIRELGIWTPNGYIAYEDDTFWALVVSNQEGYIAPSSGRVLIPPAPDASMLLPAEDCDPYFPGEGGVYGQVMSYGGNANPGVYFDQIIFHMEWLYATVQLWTTRDFETYELADQVYFCDPEPTTIALLGLGGLALLRNRRFR